MIVWVIRGKWDSGNNTSSFSANKYVNIIVVLVYSNIQVIYCVFLSRHFKLEEEWKNGKQ